MAGEVSFNDFVEKAYAGIPDRTTTVEQKERAIAAKKKILAHPDCPSKTKEALRNEIATIQGEIDAMNNEARTQSMNSSIYPPRNNLG